jgi:hypothetical protein
VTPDRRRELVDLAIALGLAAAYAVSVVLRRSGHWLVYDLSYNLPIVVPFALLLLDRFRKRSALGVARCLVDAVVIALAASRVFLPVPFVSGHALFLTHALGTTRGVPRVAAALVMAEVTVFKIVWMDPSWLGGVVIGILGTWAWKRCARSRNVPASARESAP